MDKIGLWLKRFKENWQNHNIDGVLSLFDKNVIYYETPFVKLDNFEKLSKQWKEINNQKNVVLDLEIFSSSKNKHSVIWRLQYQNRENVLKFFSGTYLIELNNDGLCTYFHHSCEQLKENLIKT